MNDPIFNMETLQGLGGRLLIIGGAFCLLFMGGIMMLLLISDLLRARGREISHLRKFGHEPQENRSFARALRERFKGPR